MKRSTGLKTIIILLLAILLAVVFVNPTSQQQIVTEAGLDVEFTEPVRVIGDARDQKVSGIWEDNIVYTDYISGNWDVKGYNYTSNTTVSYEYGTSHSRNPSISDEIVVWEDDSYDPYTHTHIKGMWRDNLTTFWIPYGVKHERPKAYGDVVIHTNTNDGANNGLYLYNATSNVSHKIRDDIFTTPYSYDMWRDYVVVFEPSSQNVCLWKNSTDSVIILDSSDTLYGRCHIHENHVVYGIEHAGELVIKHYNIDTGVTTIVQSGDEDDIYVYLDIYGNWIVYSSYEYGNIESMTQWAYNIDTKDIYEFAGSGVYKVIWGNYIFWSEDTETGTGYDIWMTIMTTTDIPEPPAPETPEEAIAEFIADYGLAILGIIAIIGVALFIEWRKYQWEHLKSKRGKTTAGLLISIALIVVLVLLLIA